MATYNRPTILPTWCADNNTNVAQPPDSLRAVGYVGNEAPMAEHYNWLANSYGNWLGYLDQANAATVMGTTLDVNTRLVGGGNWSYNATTNTLKWDAAASLLIPSIPTSDNSIAAGSVVLGENVVAYVQANVPYTTSGGLTSGSKNVTGIAMSSAVSVGQSVTGAGVPDNTTVTEVSESTLTLSQAATATNSKATLTFAGSGALTVQASAAAALLPNANTVIIAIGRMMTAIVGVNSGQMVLRHGEQKTLMGSNGYASNLVGLAGVSLLANTAVYLSPGGADGTTGGSLYPCDPGATNGAVRAKFLGFTVNQHAGNNPASVVTVGNVNGFTGLTVGAAHYLDPANVGKITAVQPTTVGQYVVPVGIATSATTLSVNAYAAQMAQALAADQTVKGNLTVNGTSTMKGAATVPTISSGAGFKSVVDAGSYHTQSNPAKASLMRVRHNDGSGNPTYESCAYVMSHPGSVVGLEGNVYLRTVALNQINIAVIIFVNASPVYLGPYNQTQKIDLQFAKGQLSFNRGDTVYVGFDTSSTGNLLDMNATMMFEFGA